MSTSQGDANQAERPCPAGPGGGTMSVTMRRTVVAMQDHERFHGAPRPGWQGPVPTATFHDVVDQHVPSPVATGRATEGRVLGLDGLRGLAVLAVLVFHLWPAWLPGGFIGVTLFFALSGYLITSILMSELEGSGTISLRRFYRRRVRRLVPLSLLTITVVAVGWSLAGWFTPDLRRGTFFAVGQGANWGQILAGQKYGTDASASPLLHFWSLAIEEQLYLIIPVALLLCGTRRRGQLLMAAALAASVYAIVRSADSATLSYYSTFTRGGEVLVGGLAALTMRGHRWTHRATKVAATVFAALGLATLTIVATTRDVSDPLFSRGGLLACAVIAEIVIVAVVGWPALGRRIDWWPLARLGQISYAVYLFHWPLLQTLRRSNLPPQLVPWATLCMTLVLALASEEWFERPIRSGAVKGPRLVVAAVCTALIVPIVGAVGVSSAGASTDFEAAAAQLDQLIATGPTAPAAPAGVIARSVSTAVLRAEERWADHGVVIPVATTATVSADPLRVGFFGDSKALALGLGTANRGFDTISVGTSFTPLGCPTGRGGKVREHSGAMVVTLPKACDWTDGIPASAARNGAIDVAVVWSGTWDVNDRKVPGIGGGWTSIADPAYREWLKGEMLALTDEIVTVAGAHEVLWLTVPIDPASSHPERFAIWNELLQEVQRMRPGIVQVVDVATYVERSGDAPRLLPDGVHPSVGGDDPHGNTGAELTDRLIVPAVAAHLPQTLSSP
ncbi:MAG: hypothetical protein RJA49_104 [Actinomycetota bacterium]